MTRTGQPGCPVHWLPLSPRLHWLLLLVAPFHTARFWRSTVTTPGVHWRLWAHLLLPKVPLQVELHQAVLGHSKIQILQSTLANHSCTYGEDCQGIPWQCPPSSNSAVSSLLFVSSHLCLILFSRSANHSAHFITTYREGLSGAQASCSHHTLPPQYILDARNTVNT